MTTPIHSLDARYYTDPSDFCHEQAGLFARTWQFACHLLRPAICRLLHQL